jgi:hypothetical protein
VQRLDRIITAAAVVVIAVLGFLPIANWIPGGLSMPTWGDLVGGWWSGTVLVVGIAAVIAVLTRKVAALPGEGVPARLAASFAATPRLWTAAIALVALGIYLAIAREIFSAKPLLIDEIAQVYQARIFASGALSLPVPSHPEFFSSSLVLNLPGKVFSQFPAGAPAMLALGSWVGAEWMVDPVFAAVSVILFSALVRRIEPRPGVALAATLLFAFAPFVAFMSGSHMNHVTGLTWLLLGMLGLARVMERDSPRIRDGLLLGLGFGVAATIRPIDAAVFALPAGLWLLGRTLRSGGWPVLFAAGLGIALPVAALMRVNQLTTGAALSFGYITLWGAAHDIGFHVSPWGEPHTPARGLELLNLYFVRLQSYLFETPFPSLVPALGALALTPRLSRFDRYLLATAGLLLVAYWAYWHDGFYIGPRFMIPLVPFLALWSARSFAAVRERFPGRMVARAFGLAVLAGAGIALAVSVPIRAREYRNGMLTMRWDADAAAGEAGISHALVFVRESWGAQLVARMWAAGVSRSEAEHQYRKSDACAMEQTLDRIEREGLRGAAAVQALAPLFRDSARLIVSPLTTDPTNRVLPGSRYTAGCLARLRQDQEGFTLLLPLLLAGRNDVIYARDMQGRDSLLLREYPDRAVYLLRPPSTAVGAAPRFYPLQRDSLLAAWRAGR